MEGSVSDFDVGDLRIKPGERLFGGDSGNWRNVAMVLGTSTRHVPYAVGFKDAGDALIRDGLANHMQDLVFFPALYCYRHALELGLKDLIYLGRRADHGSAGEVLISHKLTMLWPQARDVIEKAWPDGDTAELDAMESLVTELAAVDLDGEQFRYDVDPKGYAREVPKDLQRVDLQHLGTVMGKLFALLSGALDGISEMVAAMPGPEDY
jgi:hypothetical protein